MFRGVTLRVVSLRSVCDRSEACHSRASSKNSKRQPRIPQSTRLLSPRRKEPAQFACLQPNLQVEGILLSLGSRVFGHLGFITRDPQLSFRSLREVKALGALGCLVLGRSGLPPGLRDQGLRPSIPSSGLPPWRHKQATLPASSEGTVPWLCAGRWGFGVCRFNWAANS